MWSVTSQPRTAGDALDQRVELQGVRWDDYERLLEIRGEKAIPRMTYCEGVLELMTPSLDHEHVARAIGRLLECFVEERGIALNSYGHWTIRRRSDERGLEPDGCYVVGAHRPSRPDLAIEVIWTHGGIEKLAIYRGLGVPEIWIWQSAGIEVYVLSAGGQEYERRAASALLPDLDLGRLAELALEPDQTAAVRAFRAEVRRG